MYKNTFIRFALVVGVTFTSATAVATCHLVGGGALNSTLALQSMQITVGRDIPVGTEVYRQEFNPAASTSISCEPGTGEVTIKRRLVLSAAPVPGLNSHAGATVYATSVAGIGVQFRNVDNRALAPATTLPRCNGSKACVEPLDHHLKFIVSFIKVSTQVEAGAISAVDLPALDFSYELKGQQYPVRSVRLAGQLRVVAQTCKTPNVQVNMGMHKMNDLELNGHSDWQNFDIVLNQCPAFHGYYAVKGLAVAGGPPGAMFNPNKIAFRIDPTLRALADEMGILSLTPQRIGGVKTARGIGVQLARENEQPIRLSTLLDSAILTQPSEGGSYFIRLKARYIRQADGVFQSGPANATATFTINYQ